jgi:hypothetical protein
MFTTIRDGSQMDEFIKLQQTNLLHRFTAAGLPVKTTIKKTEFMLFNASSDCTQALLTSIQQQTIK